MGKKFRRALGFIAAIAIPFAAPAIASAIGLSSVIGATAGSALVGAGLGAANAAVLTGGDVGRGALLGGISGGISGYFQAPSSYSSGADAAATGAITPEMAAGNMAGLEASMATPIAAPPMIPDAELLNLSALSDAGGAALPTMAPEVGGAGLQNVPVSELATPLSGTAAAPAVGPTTALNPTEAAAAFSTRSVGDPYVLNELATGNAMAAPPGFGEKFMTALRAVPGEISNTFSDPKRLADLTLRVGGALAGNLIVGQGLSKEEQQILDAYTQDMKELQQTNKELFNQRMEQAMAIAGDAKYFDPEYFGLQRARRAQIAGARQKQAGLRGMEGPERAVLERQYDLGISRNVGSAYDQGYLTGVQGGMQTRQAGLSALPSFQPVSFQGVADISKQADARRAQQLSNFNQLYGAFTGSTRSSGSAAPTGR